MSVWSHFEPKTVFEIFEGMCGVPHGSGNTKQVSDYLVGFAKEHGLQVKQDALNNVVVYAPATPGYEDHDPVLLQGHMDMVCEKTADKDFDFETQGLDLRTDGVYIFADRTTLGGDDGIGVALALALALEAKEHPALEILVTVDEETGMNGAEGFDPAWISSRKLVNLDSEGEGIFIAGCAGGIRVQYDKKPQSEPNGRPAYRIFADGFTGGHSGAEIDKGRQNAVKTMGKLLATLKDIRLVSLVGGTKDNAIPSRVEAVIVSDADPTAEILTFADSVRTEQDPKIFFEVEKVSAPVALTEEESAKLIEFVNRIPDGVQAFSKDLPGFPETSLNLGVTSVSPDELKMRFLLRSSVNESKARLADELEVIGKEYGCSVSRGEGYPAWEYLPESSLRDTMAQVFRAEFGKDPVIEVMHAGVECGLIADKLPGLQAVSIGPDIYEIHTPRERCSVASVARSYRYLTALLKAL